MTCDPQAAFTLASASAARRNLLEAAGLSFRIRPARVDEESLKDALLAEGTGPRDIADALAEAKALQVSRILDGLVVGSDQTLDLEGVLFGKPGDMAEARAQLLQLRGRAHRLHAAAVLCRDGRPIWRAATTAVLKVRAFSDAFLDRYLAEEGESLLSTCGGYRIEGPGVQLFDWVEGDTFTIQGLPLLPLLGQLRELGVLQK